jgi:hypothetical protein
MSIRKHGVDTQINRLDGAGGWIARLVAGVAILLTLPAHSTAQGPLASTPAASGIAGFVRDTTRRPIRLAAVTIASLGRSTVSDDSGFFQIGGLPSGTYTVTITRIGYSPIAFEASLPPDSALMVDIHMRSVSSLDAVIVKGDSVPIRFASTGFADRKKLGIGSFLGPERIDSLREAMVRPSWLLRNVRGIELRCHGASCTVHTRRPPDCIWLFIDGAYRRDEIDDALSTSQIYAIEVYERPSMVPTEFQAPLPPKRGGVMSLAAGCAALAVWTRGRAAP